MSSGTHQNEPGETTDLLGAQQRGAAPEPTVLRLQVEKIRLIAYLSFWGMCLFATILAKTLVFPNLTCQDPEDPSAVITGAQCTDLVRIFGFNNICATWDYAPSVQLTAMVYPAFEYSLLVYVLMEYVQIKNDQLNGIFPDSWRRASLVLLWVKVVLIAWFRMIFVCKVTDDPILLPWGGTLDPVTAHTIGFFGMQLALILIAFENVLFLQYRGQRMWCFTANQTRIAAWVYLAVLIVATALKISWGLSIFVTGTPWIPNSVAHYIDRTWMLLAAILPLLFAWNGMIRDPDMVISICNTKKRECNRPSNNNKIQANDKLSSNA